jgi:beta-lactamase superfamily II metal-dependent hydrolase
MCLVAGIALAQGPKGGPLDAPKGLTVWFLDVGQGDSTLIRGPTGKTLLMDGGKNGEGTRVVLPLLKSLGIRHIDYLVSSHFHPDHLGGLDEVLAKVSVGQVWDRGTWMVPSYADYKRYMTASARLRKAVTLGQKLDLGGGAFAQVMAANGKVLGGKTVTIKGRYQAENAASIVLKVEYGDFDLFLGGDLTGGGNKTPDVESVVAPIIGDVEVYKLSHHGSSTSSNTTLMRLLDPEVSVASAGYKNPYRHPSTRTLNRFNTAAGSRLIVGTTPGAGWAGFTNMGTIRVQSDGWRYRVESLNGDGMDFYVDEHPGTSPMPGDLIFSEVQRATRAPEGEYLEVYNRSGSPMNLDGLLISGRAGSVKIPVPYRLAPGGRFLFFRHGDPAKSGGLPFGHCWPYRAFGIGDTADTLKLSLGNRQLDSLSYGSSFAGGKGIAAERKDLELLPSSASNFVASTTKYGRAGDKGSPGAKYAGDKTLYPLRVGVEVLGAKAAGGKALHLFGSAFSDSGRFHVMAMSLGNSPGLNLGKVHLDLNLDSLLLLSVGLPGFTAMLPSTGLRGVRMSLPADPGLSRTKIWFAHFLVDPFKAPFFPKASKSISIILP